jgi:hypothetical protein
MFLGTAALTICLALGIKTVQLQEYYFWQLRDKHLMRYVVWIAAMAGVGIYLCWTLLSVGTRRASLIALLLIGGIGYFLQHGMAFSEGRGLAGIRHNMVYAGHAEFARTAVRGYSAWTVLRHYEQLVARRDQVFARSKPPGHLLFYMGSAKVAQIVMPVLWNPPRPPGIDPDYWHLINFAILVFPMLCYLTLVPLIYLGRVFLPIGRAHWPALLYVLAAPVTLVTMHLEQVLYPLLTTSLWALCVLAVRDQKRHAAWCVAVGVLIWISLFVSFSLLGALPIAAALAWVAIPAEMGRRRLRILLRSILVAAIPFVSLVLLAWLVAHYDMYATYVRAWNNHRIPKGWDNTYRLPAAWSTFSEFSYWMGPPILVSFLWGAWSSVIGVVRQRRSELFLGIAVLLTILTTALFGSTYTEAVRLWMFYLPAVALVAAQRLSDGIETSWELRTTASVVVAAQLVWTVALKNWQDFS